VICSFRLPAARALRLLGVLLLVLVPATPARAFSLGFNDDDLMRYAGWNGGTVNQPALNAGLGNARGAGAQTWRFMIVWRQAIRDQRTAPQPASAAADPAWSGYDWDDLDRIVRGASAQGFELLPWITRAPDWAEGPGRPAASKLIPAGTWKPDPGALEQFAKAVAKRYGGSYPDPLNPAVALPKITTFQGWNEPNLYTEITPQWEQRGGKWTMYSAGAFRNLLNGFYRGIKSVQPGATVIAAGTGPFGDFNEGDPRVQPARFWREVLCVRERSSKLTARSCPKLRFDGWAHHTYPIGPPTRTARNKDDVVVPDMKKLQRIVNAAAAKKTVSKKAAANLWITEMSWESSPDPQGLSLTDHALYMEGAFYVLWKAGVKKVIWFNSRDNAQGSDWNTTLQSGIFLRGADPSADQRKPAYTAYRFPFTAYRLKGVAALWSKLPGSGPVVVQANSGGTWIKAATLTPRPGGVATGRLRVGPGVQLRAVQGSEISLTWTTN
jgi:hypothetical protein